MNKSLYPYQIEGVEFLVRERRALLGDEMGIGKTLQALEAAHRLGILGITRSLVLCTKNATYTWRKEVRKWFPHYADKVMVIKGTKAQRIKLWHRVQKDSIVVMTYESWQHDIAECSKYSWDLLFADEAHKLKNKKTKTFKKLKKFTRQYKTQNIFLITGSPSSDGPKDTWALFNIIRPKVFPSYWQYVHKYHIVYDGPFGKEFEGTQNMEEYRKITSSFMLRRYKKEVHKDMPKKLRDIIPIDMTAAQRKLYDELAAEMVYEAEDGELVTAANEMSLRMKLRQLLVCPKIIEPNASVGAGLEWIADHLKAEQLNKAIIFTPFPSGFLHMQAYLESKGFKVLTLRGGDDDIHVESVVTSLKDMQKVLVLCSIKFAQSFDLVDAQAGYFLGAEYNPELNYQAEDRIHRITLQHDIVIYYLQHLHTCEEDLFNILDNKVRDIRPMFRTPQQIKELFIKND